MKNVYYQMEKLENRIRKDFNNIDEDIIHDLAYAKYLFMWR